MTKKLFLTMGVIALMNGAILNAQITIGEEKDPESFSVLELISNHTRGLRLPQMTTDQRDKITGLTKTEAQGLQIFNTTTGCVNTWNGTRWIELCASVTLSFDLNGGSGTIPAQEGISGVSTILPNSAGITNGSKFFAGWNTKSDGSGAGYGTGDDYTLPNDNITLYAQWGTLPIIPHLAPSDNIIMYVGAFWRANQTGERVITIDMGTNTGGWSAAVAWTDGRWKAGDIVLEAGKSLDPNFNTENPGDAENYQLTGRATAVGGTIAAGDPIIFRIGLKSTYTPTATCPARYAVITLSYDNNTKHRNLYLRQGENADYLLMPGEAATGSPARKFSPYNLTVSSLTDANEFARTTVRGATFVEYPTQAGTFFQWASAAGNECVAFHPVMPEKTSPTVWPDAVTGSFWNVLSATHKVSPAGYRRPEDGSTSAETVSPDMRNSELRGSLWTNIGAGHHVQNSDNSIYGYYADGFFDRRPHNSVAFGAKDGAANSAVAWTGKDVAYAGRLFFNPKTSSSHYNASLFFPFAGYRNNASGNLEQAGSGGYYWTSSSAYPDMSWSMQLFPGNAEIYYTGKRYGFNIRPVAE
jgi:hypothetical protein